MNTSTQKTQDTPISSNSSAEFNPSSPPENADDLLTLNAVDQFVAQCIRSYPTIYPHRTAVLYLVLCVGVAGTQWNEHGEMESVHHEDAWDLQVELSKDPFAHIEHQTALYLELHSQRRAQLHALQFIAESAEKLALIKNGREPLMLLPVFGANPISTMPDNVTSEWREACEEIQARMMFSA